MCGWPSLAAAGVHRERVRQVLVVGELVRELPRQLNLILDGQIPRQREIRTDEEPAVRPLVEVGGVPVVRRVIVGPRRHVIGLGVDRRIAIRVVIRVLARDVVAARSAHAPPAREPERNDK